MYGSLPPSFARQFNRLRALDKLPSAEREARITAFEKRDFTPSARNTP
jgi:hypothetical protein